MPSALLSCARTVATTFAITAGMETVVIVTSDGDYGRLCYDAFRRVGMFAVVVDCGARALVVLAQFRANIVIVERPARDPPEWESVLIDLAGTTPILTYPKLPKAAALANEVRDALASLSERPSAAASGT